MAAVPHVIYYRDHQPASARVLRFLAENIGTIRAMNVQLRAEEVPRPGAKGAREILNYLRKIGADELPALVTPSDVHLGAAKIFDIYEKNIRGLEAARQKAQSQKPPDSGGDLLHEYMLQGLGADDNDGEDEAMDAPPDFGSHIHMAMEKRHAHSRPSGAPGSGGHGGPGSGGSGSGGLNDVADVPVRMPAGGNQDDLLLAAFLDNNETSM